MSPAPQIETTALDGVLLLHPAVHRDDRGSLSELFNEQAWAKAGLPVTWTQDNVTHNPAAGTLRGLHAQTPPYAHAKLVRPLTGAIADVAVDLRQDSPTYGKHVLATLEAESGSMLLLPPWCAHGYVTLRSDTVVVYKMSNAYTPSAEIGVAWNDPDLGIPWPAQPNALTLSVKDRSLPRLRDLQSPFHGA